MKTVPSSGKSMKIKLISITNIVNKVHTVNIIKLRTKAGIRMNRSFNEF